ncbi:hypothetical protein DVH24_018947 [Malus domestica]|uniref:MHD domain-containing protein n=1 Tax=Malus domestica TaxID=3750 RepID=A0A498HNW9_MALDO|nr:hypothetical protein DVH24_018947 [Malus domestica]
MLSSMHGNGIAKMRRSRLGEVATSLALVVQIEEEDQKLENEEESQAENDLFAASKKINQPEELVSGFNKNKDHSAIDLTMALATLEVMTLHPAEATQSTHIAGGGLDASEFVGSKKVAKKEGLGGLELLQTKPNAPKIADAATGGAAAGTPLDTLVKSEMKGLEMHIVEEISAEFRETLVAIVGLLGVVYLKTLPTITGGNGLFHMRIATSDEPLPILKYSLVLKLTPLPLRVCLMQRHTRSLLYVMIQYVSNPELPAPLTDVTFVLKLPLDLTLLKVSPKAVLSRFDKELKWHILEIPLNGSPGRLRARIPMDSNEGNGSEERNKKMKEIDFVLESNLSYIG